MQLADHTPAWCRSPYRGLAWECRHRAKLDAVGAK